jgi:flagellar L-ring protein precursor FlgH
MRRFAFALLVLAALAAAGCQSIDAYRVPPVQFEGALPAVVAAPPRAAPAPGAIYSAAAYRPLFEDHRARLPGDTLTVNIVERITASQSSTSTVEKAGVLDAGVTALPGVDPAKWLGRATANGNSTSTFEGTGETQSRNDFTGSVTAVVTGVLPNGHLLISGEKQIGVNANLDVLRFSGQVDPRVIQPGNTVPSSQIANVRLEQRSRGQQGDAQVMGWLARFFLSVMPI